MADGTDTPQGEPGDLTLDSAAAAFSALINPPDKDETTKVDTEVDPPEPEKPAESNAIDEGGDAPITIEVDGKQVTLTKAQLADAYKNGLRQDDYTKKTMTLAEQRKAAEAETSKAQQERQTYAQNLVKMAAQLEGAIQAQDKIDWDALLTQDPVEFLKQKHLFDQRQAALQSNQQEQQKLAQQFQAEQAEGLKTHLLKEQQALLAKLPDWKDEAKAKSERDALKAYLSKEYGYDESAINGITDHRAVILGRKAMLYDQMMAKAQAAAKKVQNLPTKVERPGVSNVERNPLDGRSAAMQRHSKVGSVESAAAVFSSLLN